MILDGATIIEKKFVTLGDPAIVNTEDQIQANGVDLRVNKIYEVTGKVRIPREGKADSSELVAKEMDAKDGFWSLNKRSSSLFYVDFLENIYVPGGYCAHLMTRSSLVRSGVDVMAGLYDSGFQGTLGCTIRIWSNVEIEWGAKLCQVLFTKSVFNGKLYDGRYQNSNSQTAITT